MNDCISTNPGQQMKQVSPEKKMKSPYRWLWMIPIQILFFVLSIPAGLLADIIMWQQVEARKPPDQLGHGLPVFSVILPFLVAVITIAVTVLSIIITVIAVYRRWKRNCDCSPVPGR